MWVYHKAPMHQDLSAADRSRPARIPSRGYPRPYSTVTPVYQRVNDTVMCVQDTLRVCKTQLCGCSPHSVRVAYAPAWQRRHSERRLATAPSRPPYAASSRREELSALPNGGEVQARGRGPQMHATAHVLRSRRPGSPCSAYLFGGPGGGCGMVSRNVACSFSFCVGGIRMHHVRHRRLVAPRSGPN